MTRKRIAKDAEKTRQQDGSGAAIFRIAYFLAVIYSDFSSSASCKTSLTNSGTFFRACLDNFTS